MCERKTSKFVVAYWKADIGQNPKCSTDLSFEAKMKSLSHLWVQPTSGNNWPLNEPTSLICPSILKPPIQEGTLTLQWMNLSLKWNISWLTRRAWFMHWLKMEGRAIIKLTRAKYPHTWDILPSSMLASLSASSASFISSSWHTNSDNNTLLYYNTVK